MEKKSFDLSQIIPITTGLIIVIGVFDLVSYYHSFGVGVLYYLDFSELFMSFIEAPLIMFIYIGFGMLTAVVAYNLSFSKLETNPIRSKEIFVLLNDNTTFLKKVLLFLELQLPFVYYGIGMSICVLISALISGGSVLSYLAAIWGVILAIVSIFGLVVIITSSKLYIRSSRIIQNSIWFFLFSVLIISMVQFFAARRAEQIKKSKGLIKASLVFNDSTVFYPNDSMYIIGKTNNYFYLYNERDSISEIIPMSDIKRIIYIRKNK